MATIVREGPWTPKERETSYDCKTCKSEIGLKPSEIKTKGWFGKVLAHCPVCDKDSWFNSIIREMW